MERYDYLIVGAGLYGAVCARELADAEKKVLVVDRRPHVAGNAYTEDVDGIQDRKSVADVNMIFHPKITITKN